MSRLSLVLIGVAVIALLVMSGLVALALSRQTRFVASSPSPTAIALPEPSPAAPQATLVQGQAPTTRAAQTAAPAATAAATSIPGPSATPSALALVAKPPAPLLFDDFSSLTSGWAPLFVDPQGGINGYSAEAYAFDIATPNQILYDVQPNVSFAPVRYALEIRGVTGDGQFGLMFDVRGDPARFASLTYGAVLVTTTGDVSLVTQQAGGQVQIVQTSPGVMPAPASGRSSRLEIERRPDALVVRIDDAEVLRGPPLQPAGGGVGLLASSGRSLRVEFDSLLLTSFTPGDGPACADLRPLFIPPTGEQLSGDDVALLQRRLAHLGYDLGEVDGVYGPRTAGAVEQFQALLGLTPSGIVDRGTWCALLSDTALTASGRNERDTVAARYRPIALDPGAGLSAPLLISVRGDAQRWQLALALPGRSAVHYIDTQGDAFDPAWSPGKGLLAFTTERNTGNSEIWILNIHTGELSPVSPPTLMSQFPSWSPDGQTLMFTGEPLTGGDKTAHNYIYNLASGQISQWSAEHAGWSDWAPDGLVAFTRLTDKSFDIFVAGPDSSGAINITNTDDAHEDIPAWSPDGEWLAFVGNPRNTSDDRQIFIIRRDGTGLQQLTTLPGPNSNPIWLDRTTLVFSNQPSKEIRQPYILRLDGSIQQLSANEDRIWFMSRFDLEP